MSTYVMTPAERRRVCDRIEMLRQQHIAQMRGRMIPTTKAVTLQNEITRLQQEVDRSDREQVRQSRFNALPREAILEIMAVPVVADVLNDFASRVDSSLRKAGLTNSVFGDNTRKLRGLSLKVVDVLANADNGLGELIEYDETLVCAVCKKVLSFIQQRLPKIATQYDEQQ